ncbi:MAG: DUF2974 domain-containing protein [Lachnospiraceae bacterium]|nr:DUF2974 domain-containing protein [Lachnospiraceae bacterium]
MGNIISYLKEYGSKSFQEYHFCEVDILVLAQLSYLKFDGAVPALGERKKAVTLLKINEIMNPDKVFEDKWYEKQNRELWSTLLSCKRYQRMKCNYYRSRLDEENVTQFGAITFFPEGCEPVVAFRGTDGSIVGWKEDFNMVFSKPIPSQMESALYLEQVSCRIPGSFMVCGHSKGGNLAVYSSIWADGYVQQRITDIYSLDGPGFVPEVISGASYENIRDRIHRILPYSSLVGMLLQNYEFYEVVKSSAFGPRQHDCYTWEIEDGAFVKAPDIEAKQKRMNEVLNQWIFSLPEEERMLFVNALFETIEQTKVLTVSEFAENWQKNLKLCFKHMRKFDATTRKRFRQIFKMLFEIYGSVLRGRQHEGMEQEFHADEK